MIQKAAGSPGALVAPEELERRVAEYRRRSFENQAPAQVVYPAPHHPCPWPGCDLRIAGINFQWEQMGDPARRASLFAAWWQGPGLVGKCPGCGRYVLFSLEDKQAVANPGEFAQATLPEDWHTKAHLVVRTG